MPFFYMVIISCFLSRLMVLSFLIFTVLEKIYFFNADRSSHQRCSVKKGVLKNFANFLGKHLYWSLFLIKLQAYNFIKKRLRQRCFPVQFAKILRTSILKNICERLLFWPAVGNLVGSKWYFDQLIWFGPYNWRQ